MSNILNESITKVQLDYLDVLKQARDKMTDQNYHAIVDEILVFWKKHKRLAESILRHYIVPMETFVFTGATLVDVEDYEHYPFLALGKKHIVDDPLCRYLETAGKLKDKDVVSGLLETAKLTLEDNIKLIEHCYPNIVILPLRYLCDIDEDLIHKNAINAFLSMFNENIQSLEDYRKLQTIDDINANLLPDMDKNIIFTINENTSLDMTERFETFIEHDEHTKFLKNDHNKIFFFTIIGYITQALNIIMICMINRCIPYIRYEVAFKYVLKLVENFKTLPEAKEMIAKTSIGYVLYKEFDKEAFKQYSFQTYIELLKRHNSECRIFELIGQENLNVEKMQLSHIIEKVDKYLEELISDEDLTT